MSQASGVDTFCEKQEIPWCRVITEGLEHRSMREASGRDCLWLFRKTDQPQL